MLFDKNKFNNHIKYIKDVDFLLLNNNIIFKIINVPRGTFDKN